MFAQETHEYIRDHIKFADQKAAFLFTTGSAILVLLYSRSFQNQWIAAPTDPASILSFPHRASSGRRVWPALQHVKA